MGCQVLEKITFFRLGFRPLSEGEGTAGRIIDFFDDQILLSTYTGGKIAFVVAYTGSDQYVLTSDSVFGGLFITI